MHRRTDPVPHALKTSYPILRLELSEVDQLARTLRLFNLGKRGFISFHAEDYGAQSGEPLSDFLTHKFKQLGLKDAPTRIELITSPRICGFAFNPISIFLCRNNSGALQAVIFEVNSTFGERCHYAFRASDGASEVHYFQAPKVMRVSPFNHTLGEYRFRLVDGPDQINLAIQYLVDGKMRLNTSLSARFEPITDRRLLRHFGLVPFSMLSTLASIHWNALLLWLKGVPFIPGDRAITRLTEDTNV